MTVIRPTGNLDSSSVMRCIQAAPDDPLDIDLRACRFVRPAGMVWLGLLLDKAAADSRECEIRTAPGSDVAKYVDRMGLGDLAIARGARIVDPLPGVTRFPRRHRFLELTRFDSGGASVIDDVCETVKAKSAEWEIDGRRLYNSVFELGVNVEHHAKSSGLVAVQHYPGENAVEFAIGDTGIGILASLRSAGFELKTSRDAVRMAVETTATRTGDSNRGKGLPGLKATICTEDLRGVLTIFTGRWCVEYRAGETEPTCTKFDLRMPGTLAVGKFRTG